MSLKRSLTGIGLAVALTATAACTGPGSEPASVKHCVSLKVDSGAVPDATLGNLLRTALAGVVRGGKLQASRVTDSGASPDEIELGAKKERELVFRPVTGDENRTQNIAENRLTPLIGRIIMQVRNDEKALGEGDDGDASHLPNFSKVDGTNGYVRQADLFGSLERAGIDAAAMENCKVKEGVLVTGGGIHRTSAIDFLHVGEDRTPLTLANAHQVHVDRITAPAGVILKVFGVSEFTNVVVLDAHGHRHGIDPDFAKAEQIVWGKACANELPVCVDGS